jgi:hypothetical protein
MVKKYKRIIFHFFGLILLALGCRENPKFELETVIVPNRADEPLSLSEMADFVQQIQLETFQGNYLG